LRCLLDHRFATRKRGECYAMRACGGRCGGRLRLGVETLKVKTGPCFAWGGGGHVIPNWELPSYFRYLFRYLLKTCDLRDGGS
jgi:hypothetical protein